MLLVVMRTAKESFGLSLHTTSVQSQQLFVAKDDAAGLEYSPVSSGTLAISHVWSHGQGGRPETGINTCLHKRYCRLAQQFGCDTYWIDAAAIPSEATLRRQAIDNISIIFATAKVTLIIDMDVQSLDIALPGPSLAQIETLISILLVSDWAVRGWTLLEGIRGSRAIFLLCKNDVVTNLRQTLIALHERGAIDIAVLLGSTQHLIPHSDPASQKGMEEAGYLLSQRHTSWPEDVIICWSLLMNAPVQRNAAELWKSQVSCQDWVPNLQRSQGGRSACVWVGTCLTLHSPDCPSCRH